VQGSDYYGAVHDGEGEEEAPGGDASFFWADHAPLVALEEGLWSQETNDVLSGLSCGHEVGSSNGSNAYGSEIRVKEAAQVSRVILYCIFGHEVSLDFVGAATLRGMPGVMLWNIVARQRCV
jgi:hypothetical protein